MNTVSQLIVTTQCNRDSSYLNQQRETIFLAPNSQKQLADGGRLICDLAVVYEFVTSPKELLRNCISECLFVWTVMGVYSPIFVKLGTEHRLFDATPFWHFLHE